MKLKITVQMYRVGFGDCFLLSFRYPRFERHVLVDFGSTGLPKSTGSPKAHMLSIAKDIARLSEDLDISADRTQEIFEELRDARESADRLRNIVRDLKIFSRSTEDERRGPVDVNRLLESTVWLGAPKHETKILTEAAKNSRRVHISGKWRRGGQSNCSYVEVTSAEVTR